MHWTGLFEDMFKVVFENLIYQCNQTFWKRLNCTVRLYGHFLIAVFIISRKAKQNKISYKIKALAGFEQMASRSWAVKEKEHVNNK